MNRDQQLAIAVQALRDVMDPISKVKREMKAGYTLSGMAFEMLNYPSTYVEIARDGLRKMGRKP